MKPKRRNSDYKTIVILMAITFIIGWVGTGGGKYDHVHWSLGGFEKQQFTVGDTNEQIEVQLDTSGRNWDLSFDEDECTILVEQDDRRILEGWFISLDEFTLWENNFHMEDYTIINYPEEANFYFCLSNEGEYIFLSKIEGSDYGIIFFTPNNTEITQKKSIETFRRLTITLST